MTDSSFNNLTIIDRLNITLSNLNMTHLIGKIKMYAGTTLPAGYVWCDGTNGTPDLKNNKFIISDISGGSQQQLGNNSFTNNMISHTHAVNISPSLSIQNSNSNIFSSGATTMGLKQYFKNLNTNLYTPSRITASIAPTNGSNVPVSKRGDSIKGTIGSSHTHGPGPIQTVAANINAYASYVVEGDFNNEKNVSLGETGSNREYLPPCIEIGFIMKT